MALPTRLEFRSRIKLDSKAQFFAADLLVFLFLTTVIYGVVTLSREWRTDYRPLFEIDLSIHALPRYTVLSALRGIAAYFVSLGFTIIFGYWAAKSKRAEKFILPFLDLGQSIPVLGFLPGLVLGLIAVFPDSNIGLELACLLMIFTGQAWNMAFSFFDSVRSVPEDLNEAATMVGLNWWERLWQVELPFSAVNLAWNSVLSMAGGWFFLNVCEAFVLGNQKFRLPGIGSYMAVAWERGDMRAVGAGLLAMGMLIVMMDFFIWHPVLSWVQCFRLEEIPGVNTEEPLMSVFLRKSRIIEWMQVFLRRSLMRRRLRIFGMMPIVAAAPVGFEEESTVTLPMLAHESTHELSSPEKSQPLKFNGLASLAPYLGLIESLIFVVMACVLLYFGWKLVTLLSVLGMPTWVVIARDTMWSLIRVFAALVLSTLWTVPLGVWLGVSSRRMRVAQPLIQVMAAFPAPMLFPIFVAPLLGMGMSFEVVAGLLMMVAIQWYILFNVLAGAMRIPLELEFAMDIMRLSNIDRWRSLYLPCIFPSLVTGWVFGAGGAWNASIVTEYVAFKGNILEAAGLGSLIAIATEHKDFPLLAASLTVMVAVVVVLNRFLWAKLVQVSQSRFRMDL